MVLDRYKPWMEVKCVRTGSLMLRAAIRAEEFEGAIKILQDHRWGDPIRISQACLLFALLALL